MLASSLSFSACRTFNLCTQRMNTLERMYLNSHCNLYFLLDTSLNVSNLACLELLYLFL